MDIVNTVASTLNIDSGSAQGAIGGVLKLLKDKAPPEAFSAVEEQVPETSKWIVAAASTPGDGGGLGSLLGSALGGLGGSLGGLGELAGLAGTLSKFGLDAGAMGKLVPLVMQFLQSKVGAAVLAQLVAHVPALAKLGGGGAGAGESPLGGLGGLFK
jgi:hypothetical protein